MFFMTMGLRNFLLSSNSSLLNHSARNMPSSRA
jgi:hypothetical protein